MILIYNIFAIYLFPMHWRCDWRTYTFIFFYILAFSNLSHCHPFLFFSIIECVIHMPTNEIECRGTYDFPSYAHRTSSIFMMWKLYIVTRCRCNYYYYRYCCCATMKCAQNRQHITDKLNNLVSCGLAYNLIPTRNHRAVSFVLCVRFNATCKLQSVFVCWHTITRLPSNLI